MAEKLSSSSSSESSDEQLKEEFETLDSIYQDDDNFKILDPRSLTYKFYPTDFKEFIVQFDFTSSYPDDPPNIHMELLYNTKLRTEEKDAIIYALQTEADNLLGVQMVYSLLEWGKDNLDEVVAEFSAESNQANSSQLPKVRREKKEHLTKATKRKLANMTDAKGEKPRGWNWVDVIKHLSKTGDTTDSQPS
ncbi:RWD domain-containing protein 4 [Oopsacas minuta]|uniref:RWD domain-containing protein 4 n=1 Tax=Oopsacas minuta TaxID=111878 RepID=A0AAV7JRU5_9METZ|nr:RWD domain-containing protein 4 [Oopsacas minuta]